MNKLVRNNGQIDIMNSFFWVNWLYIIGNHTQHPKDTEDLFETNCWQQVSTKVKNHPTDRETKYNLQNCN